MWKNADVFISNLMLLFNIDMSCLLHSVDVGKYYDTCNLLTMYQHCLFYLPLIIACLGPGLRTPPGC